MKRKLIGIFSGLAALCLISSAQAGKDAIASPDEPHGVVRADVERTAEQIFPVHVVEIDGDLVSRDNQVALWLKPGKHTLKVRGHLNHDNATGLKRTVGRGGATNELEIDVEAGKIYYIGGKKNLDTDNVWTPVVWKVESAKQGAS